MTGTGHLARTANRLVASLAAVALIALFFGWTANAIAHATSSLKVVRYRDFRIVVPTGWPVYNLAADPAVCVRFDRHAVYLGQPSANQRCPAHAAGHTEAILAQPMVAHAARDGTTPQALRPATNPGAQGSGSAARIAIARRGLVVTATWREDPGLVARALGVRRIRATSAAAAPAQPQRLHAVRAGEASVIGAGAASVMGAGATGAGGAGAASVMGARVASGITGGAEVYTGLGFDACSAPSTGHMAAWAPSPYRAVGIDLGGANMACSQTNLTPSWVAQESAAGWHLIPTYVGLQAPSNQCGCAGINPGQASAEGAAAAADAIQQAQSLGIGTGNPIYFDMENYARGGTNSSAVLAFLSAWTSQLHADGFKSGIYSNADSGILDLIGRLGTGYPEPDDIWFAHWNGKATASDPYIPGGDWPGQRLHQYDGAHNETHGGVTINIDGDYLNGLTAGPSTSIAPDVAPYPQLSVSPLSNGTVYLRASWTGTSNVNAWQVLAGSSPQNLTPFGGVIKGTGAGIATLLHSEFAYFAVEALGNSQQVIGSGQPPATNQPPTTNGQPPTTNGQPPTTNGQPPTTNGQPPTSNGQPSTTNGQPPTTSSQPVAANGEPVVGTSPTIVTPAHLAIYGHSAYVSPGGVGGLPAGCFTDSPWCAISTTIRAGRTLIARTGRELLSANGGLLMFRLSRTGRALLARAASRRLPVRVTARDAGGPAVTSTLSLIPFATSGSSQAHSSSASGPPGLRIIGKTQFVSNGVVGGILTACFGGSACQVRTKVTAAGTTIASTSTEALGANELGYMIFKLTARGRTMLARARGNHLAAQVALSDTSTGAAANSQVTLVSFR